MKVSFALIRFLVVFFAAFFVTSVILFAVDFYPEPKDPVPEAPSINNEGPAVVEAPARIVIPSIGVDTLITNPSSDAISVLDEALLEGAVRYPGSALLGEDAPIFLFGHQSYLPVVRNPAFKAFNGLQKLETGDEIRLEGDTGVYTYRVTSVSLVEADEALIPLTAGARTLALSTCNSFGDPGERYVVEAEFVSQAAL